MISPGLKAGLAMLAVVAVTMGAVAGGAYFLNTILPEWGLLVVGIAALVGYLFYFLGTEIDRLRKRVEALERRRP